LIEYWKKTAFRNTPVSTSSKSYLLKPSPAPSTQPKVNEFGDPLGPQVNYRWPKPTGSGQWELSIQSNTWQNLGLPRPLAQELKRQHVNFPSETQSRGLAAINTGRDNLLIQAPAGSGKTLTFVLGTLAQVDCTNQEVQVLCLSPTLELNRQLASVFWVYAQSLQVSVSLVNQVWTATQVVVMNPLQCTAMLRPGALPALKFLVLDEADYLLQEPHFSTIARVFSLLGPVRKLLVSSTFSEDVLAAVELCCSPCERLTVSTDELLPASLRLYYAQTADSWQSKIDMLERLLAMPSPGVTVIFVNSGFTAEALVQMMSRRGVRSAMLAGTMSPEQRRNTLSLFHRGQLAVLVATNLLAWGIDEVKVSRVVNFDLPRHPETGLADAETFLRRVGRACRFGRPGVAVSIVACEADLCMLEDVMMQWGCSVEPIV